MTGQNRRETAAVILAGGRGSRMGGGPPKPLVPLAGRPLIAWVLAALPEGIDRTIVNTGAPELYAAFGCPVVADRRSGHAGPLAGLEAAAHWLAREAPAATHLLSLPADTPFLTPAALQQVLRRPGAQTRVARHAGRLHPTVALWPLAALGGLSAYLDAPGKHALSGYLETIGFEVADVAGDDLFFNVNTPEDLQEAERRAACG